MYSHLQVYHSTAHLWRLSGCIDACVWRRGVVNARGAHLRSSARAVNRTKCDILLIDIKLLWARARVLMWYCLTESNVQLRAANANTANIAALMMMRWTKRFVQCSWNNCMYHYRMECQEIKFWKHNCISTLTKWQAILISLSVHST